MALELAGRQAVFTAASGDDDDVAARDAACSLGRTSVTSTAKPAALSLRLLPASDIRPVMMPLLPDRAMRLTVSLNTAGDHAECLLTADTASVDEAAAAAWLAALKSAIEHPLRLFV